MSKRLNFIETPLRGLFRVDRQLITDERGFFSRLFCAEEFESADLNPAIMQMNHTLTKKKGAIRGLHFQYPPNAETKVVTCIRGKVYDVAVDIRAGSPTFLHWHAEVLSESNQSSLYIPNGFAHGFQALTDDCQLLYFHSTVYTPKTEGGLNVLDSKLAIEWPLEVTEISERDYNHATLNSQFEGLII